MTLERLHTYEELTETLNQIEARSGGRVAVESIGRTNEGRDIWLARAGTGPTGIMILSQQHGNEPLSTEASLQVLQRLATGYGPDVRELLEQVTLTMVVRANPDGAERYQRWNIDPDCAGQYCEPGVGYDINRNHDPAVAPDDNPVPEAAAIRRAYDRYQPDIVVDFHHTGQAVAEDGSLITASLQWPNAGGLDADVVDGSKRAAWVMANTLSHYGFAEVSTYNGGTSVALARNAYAVLGSSTVLMEVRGVGQKSSGYRMRIFFVAMSALAEAAAEGTLADVDPALADTIPARGPNVNDPTE